MKLKHFYEPELIIKKFDFDKTVLMSVCFQAQGDYASDAEWWD